MKINFKLLTKNAKLPTKAHRSDAGFDLYSTQQIVLKKGKQEMVSLEISSEIPQGYFVSIRDRSSLAVKNRIHVFAGVIDSGYRGEWKVVLANLGEKDYIIKPGDRIAQGVTHVSPEVDITGVAKIKSSKRGSDGFGSSGR